MDPIARSWHEIHAKNVFEREKSHEARLKRRKLDLKIQKSKAALRVHMKVPAHMSLFDNYDETVGFINNIKTNVFDKDAFVFLDFSACTQMSTETCVVLAAEIDRCKRKVRDSIFGSYPTNAQVYDVLNEIGFFQLVGVKASKPIFDNSPEIAAVRLQSGSDNPANMMKGMKELFYSEDGINPQSPYSGKVFRALTEAMANAVEHAYPENYRNANAITCVPVWWRAGFKLHKSNQVLIILYDQGAGIPNTLDVNWKEKLAELSSFLAREPFDDEKLVLAMEKGRSRTRQPGRGQGSYDMQSLIRESKEGVLTIFSCQGKYEYGSDGNWGKNSLKTPLNGTLVIWQVCLDTLESTSE